MWAVDPVVDICICFCFSLTPQSTPKNFCPKPKPKCPRLGRKPINK